MVENDHPGPSLEVTVDQAVADYIEAIPPERRVLFDRIHRLILEARPEVTVTLSYKMPTYQLRSRRLHLGVWKHGVSIYGWKQGGDSGFTARHPELRTSTGTIQLRPEDAADIPDDELRDLVCSALDA